MKFIKSLLKSNNFYSLSANIIIAIFGVVNFSLQARGYESKSVFGEWILFIAINSFMDMIRQGLNIQGLIKFYNSCVDERKKSFIGANYRMLITTSLLLVLVLLIIRIFFFRFVEGTAISASIKWYFLLVIVTIPSTQARFLLQAKLKFREILFLRLISQGLFFAYIIIVYYLRGTYYLDESIIALILIELIASIIAIIAKWDGLKHIMNAPKWARGLLFRFGIYSVGTQLGSHLLKSADVFIIGAVSCLGTTAIAIYGVAFKMIEFISLPVRSFVATSFPKLSAAAYKDENAFKIILYQNTGMLTILLIPLLIACFIFADFFVKILGGDGYEAAIPIFRIFVLYGLFIPLDRFTGVALDSLNMPKKNFFKVLFMAILNIGGNIIAVVLSCELWPVSISTIVTVIFGVVYGYYFVNKRLNLELSRFFTEGFSFLYRYVQPVIPFLKRK